MAQALDYAGWVEKLEGQDIDAIYSRFSAGKNLAEVFHSRFGHALDEDSLNQTHQIIIVAASLDDSTERIVAYLSERAIPINVLCFQVFTHGGEQLLSRAWLLDPVRTQVSAATTPDGTKESWNGEFYCNFDGEWADAVTFGYIHGGGGVWYSRTLRLLQPGDRVWVVPGCGFVGVGRVTGFAQPASTFKVSTAEGEVPVLDAAKCSDYCRKYVDDPDRCAYFVPVRWLQTVPLDQAVKGIGLFGNQNTVCKPTTPKWRHTVERLKKDFPGFDQE